MRQLWVYVRRAEMLIRAMRPEELEPTSALAKLTGFELDLEAECQRGWARLWVAHLDPAAARPDAFLLAWIAADEVHVIGLGTRPEGRRRGLARGLIVHLIECAKEQKARWVVLEVRLSNQAALNLYRSLGFSSSRLRRDYYVHPREDGIELLLHLDEQGRIVPGVDEVPLEGEMV